MNVSIITQADMESISALQPDGWPDISPFVKFYIDAPFCEPLKFSENNNIVGIGAAIIYHKTAWLGHIIVHKDYRNKGIGSFITKTLVDRRIRKGIKSISLIATDLGQPVYTKLGFTKETEYLFFKNDAPERMTCPTDMVSNGRGLEKEILNIDKYVWGENRKKLLEPHLSDARVCIENNKVTGFYLPTLGEGLIVATTNLSGIELMKLRKQAIPVAVVPKENEVAIQFLYENNFTFHKAAARMRLGIPTGFKARMLFNRSGGNVG